METIENNNNILKPKCLNGTGKRSVILKSLCCWILPKLSLDALSGRCSGKLKLYIPSLLAIVVYLNGLNGDFVHDDIFAIKRNRDVTGSNGLIDVIFNDFWGAPMSSNASHKSYRPLTILTFR